MLGLRVRRAALGGITVLVALLSPYPDALYPFGLIAVFLAIGEILLWKLRTGRLRRRAIYVFVAVDMALLAFALLYPNPLALIDYPATLTLKLGASVYLFVMLSLLVFAFRPSVVLWGGLVGGTAWTVGVTLILLQPEYSAAFLPDPHDLESVLGAVSDPHAIDVGVRVQEVGTFLIVAGVLAVAVWRSQRLVRRQASAERERANLARYFAPAMVDQLATRDTPLTAARNAEVAVLFVDVVGFTRWAESRTPSDVVAALRDLHLRLEALIFEHGGTLDKFIGDGVMATFGTPDPGPDDAARALRCVRAILEAFPSDGPFRLALGLHWGPVILGDLGSERRMEFAVLGDTVNVASRLEHLARELDARAVISDAAVQRAGGAEADMKWHQDVGVRGRESKLDLWTL